MKKLLGAVSLAALTAATAYAQSADNDDVIVVVGTRSEGRTALETTAPVDVVDVSALENTGITELNAALAYTLPSFNFPSPSITDGTDQVN